MPKQLQPKIRSSNTHPLLDHRLAAARNGWVQNPATLKTITCKGWPRLPCGEDDIRDRAEWRKKGFAGTALRVVGHVCALDADITIAEVADAVLDDLYTIDPEAFDRAIVRGSGGASQAVFFRTEVPFAHYVSRKYTARADLIQPWLDAHAMPDTSEEEHIARMARIAEIRAELNAQKVEIYGPLSKGRYFQYEGPHSPGREYTCGPRTPWNTSVEDLGRLPLRPGEIIDRADAIMAAMLTEIPEPPDSGEDEIVYDLTPDTLFYPKEGGSERIEDLASELTAGAENGIYGCLASTLGGSHSQGNCKLYVSSMSGRIMVKNWAANGRRHCMESDAPAEAFDIGDEARATLTAMQADAGDDEEVVAPSRARLADIERVASDEEQTYLNAAVWLLEHVAYYPQALKGRGGAISIQPDGEWQAPLSMASLREALRGYGYSAIPKGGRVPKFHNPLDAWSMSGDRIQVAGVRMRPDLPAPLYREAGAIYINRYRAPDHPTKGGTIKPFVARMEAMLPDDAERAWFMNWCRLLVQQPHWRMIAVAMVARDNGAGRGLLAETLQRVLGEEFVASMPYANISGGSRFNAEVEGKILLHVNEAAPPEGHKFHNRNAAREALKDFVEPNHNVPFRVEPKGVDAYFTKASVSTLIFTNNVNGLPLDEADRRFAVLVNGRQMSSAEIAQYRAWMENPANIGALHRELRDGAVESDRSIFDPYMAPRFTGRDQMIEAGKTMLDHAWDLAVAKLETAADLYTMSQAVAVTRHFAGAHSTDFDDLARKHTLLNGHRIGTKRPKEINWRIRFSPRAKDGTDISDDTEDNREVVFAFNQEDAGKWTQRDIKDIKKELFKAQAAVETPRKAFNKLLHMVKK